jgi:hypothetical protein
MLISNSKRRGRVAEETWDECIGNRQVRYVGYPGKLPEGEVLYRARNKIGEPWNPLTWNCEHFAYWAHGLPKQSPQLREAVVIGLICLVVGSALRRQA